MYLKAEFNLKSKSYVQIPASALLFRTGGPQVAVVQPDSTVKFRDVRIGRDNGNSIEIASGLSAATAWCSTSTIRSWTAAKSR